MISTIGLYQPGNSVLHRLSAGPKLAAMLIAVIAVSVFRELWQLGIAAALVIGVFALGRIGWRTAVAGVWPLRWMLLVIGAFQLWWADWQSAVSVCVSLLLAVAIASVVTLTTRVTAILDICVGLLRPFRRWGADPDRIGLLLALTIRCVPLMVSIIGEVNQARKARGVGFSLVALIAPAVVRALRSADAMGEALIARGYDD